MYRHNCIYVVPIYSNEYGMYGEQFILLTMIKLCQIDKAHEYER